MTAPHSQPVSSQREQLLFQEKLQTEMQRAGMDALIVTEPSAIYYATGHLSSLQARANIPGYTLAVVPASGLVKLICPDYEFQGARLLRDVEVIPQATGIFIDNYAEMGVAPTGTRNSTVNATQGFEIALKHIRGLTAHSVVGLQRSLITADAWQYLQANAEGLDLVEGARVLERARAIKTPWEVEVLRTAAQMCERVMNATGHEIYEGMTEGELMQRFAQHCFAQGPGVSNWTNAHSFGKIFAPTVLPRDLRLGKGDLVKFDTGPDYLGYISDITRVFCVGAPSDEARRLFDVLAAGYQHALSMIGPGVKVADVFRETQDLVRRSGIPTYNRGHIGHSIGTYRLGEEWPYISPKSDAVFEVGMVMAVETPYSNPDIGSMCVEDNIVITESGFEMFTRDPLRIVEV